MARIHYYLGDADKEKQIYFKEDPSFEKVDHFHDSVEFIFLTKGSLIAKISGKTYEFFENEFVFADSYETHSYIQLDNNSMGFVLVLSRELLNDFREAYGELSFPTLCNNKEKNVLIFDTLRKWHNESNKTLLLNKGYINVLLSRIVDVYPLVNREKVEDYALVKSMLRYIHENYLEDITLKQISYKFGYSVEYCSKVLKDAIDCNFREYVNRLRFRKVNELLNDKTLNLTKQEIMLKCGFSSPATFYRVKASFENNNN